MVKLQAHSLYNSCYARDGDPAWRGYAYELQCQYWSDQVTLSFDEQMALTSRIKRELDSIRQTLALELSEIEALVNQFHYDYKDIRSTETQELTSSFIDHMTSASSKCSSLMTKLAQGIVQKAVELCGQAPTDFVVVAMGMLAKGEATPYSDLDLMIVTSEESSKPYFEFLAVTLFFLIGNVGEVKLKYVKVEELLEDKWFEDTSTNGVKLGSLVKIPKAKEKQSDDSILVCTPQEVIDNYRHLCEHPMAGDKDVLNSIRNLSNICFVYGSQQMFDELELKISKVSPPESHHDASIRLLHNDVNRLNFKLDGELSAVSEIKTDIYKYPSIIIADLKILHNLSATTSWDTILEMERLGVLSTDVIHSMEFIFAVALYVRMSSCMHLCSQKDSVSVLTSTQQKLSSHTWYFPRPLLLHFFLHGIPFKSACIQLFDEKAKLWTNMTTDEEMVLSLILYYCKDWQGFLDFVKDSSSTHYHDLSNDVQLMCIDALIESCRYEEATELINYQLSVTKKDSSKSDVLSRLGKLCYVQGKYVKALKHYQKSLEVKQRLFGNADHPDMAVLYNNIASVYKSQGNYGKALECHQHSLEMKMRIYGDEIHPDVAIAYNNMALVYHAQGDCPQALVYYEKSLNMKLSIYGDIDHPDIATSYSNIAFTLDALGNYAKALEYCQLSLNMRLRVFEEGDHPDVAVSYNNLAALYKAHGQYDKALEFYEKCLQIQQRAYGSLDHRDIAVSFNNIALVYGVQGSYVKALEYHQKSLDMKLKVHQNSDHPDIAMSYSNVSMIYQMLDDYITALVFAQKSLDMRLRIYGTVDHPDIAVSYNNLGLIHKEQGRYSKALEYYGKSLTMKMKIYEDIRHPDLSIAYNNIAGVYEALGDYSKALDCYQAIVESALSEPSSVDPRILLTIKQKMRRFESVVGTEMKNAQITPVNSSAYLV